MRLSVTVFILCVLALPVATGAQQAERSLLWRITGNGMQRPSYLFGTMHLKTKKLFNFPDSLYTAMDNTDVFALEINPDSMSNMVTGYAATLLNKKPQNGNEQKEKTLREILTPAELKTLRDNLPPGSSIDPEELTVKQVYLMKDKLTMQKSRKDDLPTFMDAYLYTIAKDKAKIIAGVEHPEDQVHLLETMDLSGTDPQKLVGYFNTGMSVQDRMMELYVNKDLESLQKIADILPEQQMEMLLTVRNRTMLRSMDSIMQLHSLLCAVGALHLPGANGLIALLRAKGYTVEPVISAGYTNGASYRFKANGQPWVDVTSEQDGYSIKMPGKPSDLNTGNGTVLMKMYYDLATAKCFIISHISLADNAASPVNKLMDTVANKILARATDIKVRPVTNGGISGREYTFIGESAIHYRMQLLASSTDFYTLTAYTQSPAIGNVDSFFNTFRLIPKSATQLSNKTLADIGLTISVPEYAPTRAVEYSKDSAGKQTMYTIVDPANGIYYFIVCNEALMGNNYNNDTLFLYNMKLKLETKNITTVAEKVRRNGYEGYDVATSAFKGMKIKSRLIFCGNREYNILIQFPDNGKGLAAADSALQSISIAPALLSPVHRQMPGTKAFSTFVPSPFITDSTARHSDDTMRPPTLLYRSFDESALITYEVSVKRLNPYYWKKDDTIMLKAWLDRNLLNTDAVPSYTYYQTSGTRCAEALAYKTHSDKIHRLKVVADGRTRYALDCTYPAAFKDSRQVDSFFSFFKILQNDRAAMQPSSGALFTALHSADSATRAGAISSLNEVFFSGEDAPALLRELATGFPDDTGSMYTQTIAARLFNLLDEFSGNVSLQQLVSLYHSTFTVRRQQQFHVLGLMAQLGDSVAAYKTIKQLLLSSPPAAGSQYLLGARLKAHPAMAKALYPALLQQCADTAMGYMVCNLASYLLDSDYLSKSDIESTVPALLAHSSNMRQQEQRKMNGSLLSLLSHMDGSDVWNEIKQYQYVPGNYLRYTAVDVLTDTRQQPDPSAIDSIAADRDYRLHLYYMLNKKNLPGLFPVKYMGQQYFAESYIAGTDEEGIYGNYRLIGERSALYKNKKQKFYLFSVSEGDSDNTQHLAIAGPFSSNDKMITIDEDDNATGVYNEPLDRSNIDNQLKVYLINKKINENRRANVED